MDRRWKLVLAFIAGTVFAEIAADPSDYIFFQLREKLTAEQSVMAWYFLTAAFYTALFAAAYMLASTRLISPENFVYAMMALVVFGVYLSYKTLTAQGVQPSHLIPLLGIPFAVAMGMLWRLRKAVD
jgi:hypothetical protein